MRIHTLPLVGTLVVVSLSCTLAAVPSATWLSTATLSLGAGMSAFALMATTATLGARWGWLEELFGGLDRVYETHKWLGIAALAFASLHVLFKADMDAWNTAAILGLPSWVTRLVRQMSILALMLIVMLALNRKIPYSQWRWWHKLSGPLFLVIIAHWVSVHSLIALASPGGIWLATLATLGVAGAFYKLCLYPLLSPHATYRIDTVDPGGSAVRLVMRPDGRGVAWRAGQFAFLSVQEPGLREPHPFTIASAGGALAPVEFLIRASGDYTTRLVAQARPGMRVEVHAPFGRFHRPKGDRREVWIAGGIGVSPFIAWLQDASIRRAGPATMFLFNAPGRDFPVIADVRALAQKGGVELIALTGDVDASIFAQRLGEIVREVGVDGVDVSFCGPAGLLRRVRLELSALGVPRSRLHHERFDFR